jgi:hypothetical protein
MHCPSGIVIERISLAPPTDDDIIKTYSNTDDTTLPFYGPQLEQSTPSGNYDTETQKENIMERNSFSADASANFPSASPSQSLFTSGSKDDYDIDDVAASKSTPIGVNEIFCDKPDSSSRLTLATVLSSSSSSSSNSADSVDALRVAKEECDSKDITRTRS